MAGAIVDSTTVDSGGTFTAGSGSNRVLVWAFSGTRGGAGAPAITGATFGGEPMTQAVFAVNTTQRYNASTIYYLLEADIPSGSQTATATWDGGTPVDDTVQGQMYTLSGIDQTDPVVDIDSAVGETATSLTGSGLSIVTDGVAIAIGSKSEDGDSWNTPSGYTKVYLGTFDFSGSAVAYSKLTTSTTSESLAVTFSAANGATAWVAFRPVSAGSTYTITADYGSYSVTGSEAYRDIVVAAAQGSYTQTGQAAGLNVGFTLTAEYGVYDVAGSNGLIDLSMAAAGGTYDVTGQDVDLDKTFKLTAESGSYVLTGRTATLVWSNPPTIDIVSAGRSSHRGLRSRTWISRG